MVSYKRTKNKKINNLLLLAELLQDENMDKETFDRIVSNFSLA